MLSTYETEMQVNNAIIQQAEADAPKSGYDTSSFYTLQTDDNGKAELVRTDQTDIDASIESGQLDASRVNQTPDRNGYDGYLLGDGLAPNGETFGSGISFPTDSVKGDYFLRVDMMPNRLFRYDSQRWVKMETVERQDLSNTTTKQTQKGTFVNNTNTSTISGEVVPERQGISQALKPKADN